MWVKLFNSIDSLTKNIFYENPKWNISCLLCNVAKNRLILDQISSNLTFIANSVWFSKVERLLLALHLTLEKVQRKETSSLYGCFLPCSVVRIFGSKLSLEVLFHHGSLFSKVSRVSFCIGSNHGQARMLLMIGSGCKK